MKNFLPALVTLVMIFYITSSAPLQLNITCQKCTISCMNTNCFRLKAGTFDQQLCGYQQCDQTMKASLDVTQCSNQTCSSKVCLSNGALSYCHRGATNCDPVNWYRFSCGSCIIDLGCSQCMTLTSNTFNGEQRACNSSCMSGITYNVSYLSCSASIPSQFGSTCPCCISIAGFESQIGRCSATNGYFNTSDFDKYFLNYSQNSSNSSNIKTNGQASIIINLLVLLVLSMIYL